MRQVVIAGAVRTAVGSFGGTLKDLPAAQLGGLVIKEVLRRARIRSEKVDQVIMGNVLQAGQGQNPARQAAANAGISQYTPAVTVNVLCGSGLESVIMATQAIRAGDAEIIVAGGMESMSQAPFVLTETRWGQRMGHGAAPRPADPRRPLVLLRRHPHGDHRRERGGEVPPQPGRAGRLCL